MTSKRQDVPLVVIWTAVCVLMAVTMWTSGCALPTDGDDAGVEVDVEAEALTTSTNNSCLRKSSQANGCAANNTGDPNTPWAQSISLDSSPKRACMRGYLKKKSRDLFVCPDWDGVRDQCWRGPVGPTTSDYYRADGCIEMAIEMGDGRAIQRTCRLSRYRGSDGAFLAREGFLSYWADGSTCDVFEEGHSQPTQQVNIRTNQLFSPPPAPGGNHCSTVVGPSGVTQGPVCVDLGGGLRQCKRC